MKKYIIYIASALVLFAGCTKDFEVKDTNYLTGSAAAKMVEENPEFLSSYVNGMYSFMLEIGNQHTLCGHAGITQLLEVMCDDVVCDGTGNCYYYDVPHGYGGFKYNRASYIWQIYYTLISKANEIIDFFGTEDPDIPLLRGYLGQAYAMRAFSYYYLIQIYQDPTSGTTSGNTPAKLETTRPGVPIIYCTRDAKSSEEVDKKQGRNTIADVMTHIEENIALAEPLLAGYARASKNEINENTLDAIAARYYLLTQQWDKAAEYAQKAQNGYTVIPFSEVTTNGFNEIEDKDVLWGFDQSSETSTVYASLFSMICSYEMGYAGLGYDVHCCSKQLYDQISVSDARREWFNDPTGAGTPVLVGGTNYKYCNKKFLASAEPFLEDYVYARVEEMVLIEAEAEARLGNGGAAATALKKLMSQRDKLWNESSVDADDVLLQRRIELWSEGFRYFDIRRNGLGVDRTYEGTNFPVASRFKADTFKAHADNWNFQIPLTELQNNTHITEEEQTPYTDPSE